MAVATEQEIEMLLQRPCPRPHGMASGRWHKLISSAGDGSGGTHSLSIIIPTAVRARYVFEYDMVSVHHTVVLTATVAEMQFPGDADTRRAMVATTRAGVAISAVPLNEFHPLFWGLVNLGAGAVSQLGYVEVPNVNTKVLSMYLAGWYYDRAQFRGGAGQDRNVRE